MITDRFKLLRNPEISKIFTKAKVISIWRKIVKKQLRDAVIQDLFDYYDFNYFIEDKARTIISDLKKGSYRSQSPLVYKIEKKYGVCRHMILPQPMDALVLQTLTEHIYPKIKKKAPTKNAFYSRNRSNSKKPHEISEFDSFSWLENWKRMQKEIYRFNQDKNFIVVTDLTNYFDSVDLQDLRHFISTNFDINETTIDLVFRIITDIAWIPDYLPFMPRGLPTINIEAIRLLAHSYLFEIDKILKKKTDGNFARWMDDITIGCDSIGDGSEIISSISDVLKSRGLALNLSKTNIYSAIEGKKQFCISENLYLDELDAKLKADESIDISILKKEFVKQLRDDRRKSWDKIIKRFFTLFSKLSDAGLLRHCSKLYEKYPGLRPNIINYFSNLEFQPMTSRKIRELLEAHKSYDSVSKFLIIQTLVKWNIPYSKKGKEYISEIRKAIGEISSDMDFYCHLYFRNKYDSQAKFKGFITKFENKWKNSSFLRRQVASVLPRIWITYPDTVEKYYELLLASGDVNVMTLITSIKHLMNINTLDKLLSPYLFPTTERFFPQNKFNVLCAVLSSEKIKQNNDFIQKIREKDLDDFHKEHLKLYGI
jgi:hypothetical protein